MIKKGDFRVILETKRLFLRPWAMEDAQALYQYAKDPKVGPQAGWPPHKNIQESQKFIEYIFSAFGMFALVHKKTWEIIGSIGILIGECSNLDIGDNDGELIYWLGVPYWNQGLITEAAKKMLWYGFDELFLENIWCGYFEGNDASKRVQEKCKFTFHHTIPKVRTLTNEEKTEHVMKLTREDWEVIYIYS